MKQDRFLVAILVAVCILVIAALVLFFNRQSSDAYGSEDSPEGVVRNYVIAIHKEDFQRAYDAIQDLPEKPTYQNFIDTFLNERNQTSSVSVKITETKVFDGEAIVKLIITHGGTNPFEGTWHEGGSALLVSQNGEWKLTNMPYPYWGWDW
jgi:hypothetical protein